MIIVGYKGMNESTSGEDIVKDSPEWDIKSNGSLNYPNLLSCEDALSTLKASKSAIGMIDSLRKGTSSVIDFSKVGYNNGFGGKSLVLVVKSGKTFRDLVDALTKVSGQEPGVRVYKNHLEAGCTYKGFRISMFPQGGIYPSIKNPNIIINLVK